jgi:hypothetical protein
MLISLIILMICLGIISTCRKSDNKNASLAVLGVSLLGLVGGLLLEQVGAKTRSPVCPTTSTSDTLRTVTLVFTTV